MARDPTVVREPIVLSVQLLMQIPVPAQAVGAAMKAFPHFRLGAKAQHALQGGLPIAMDPADGAPAVDNAAVPPKPQRVAAVPSAFFRHVLGTAGSGAVGAAHDHVGLDSYVLHDGGSGATWERGTLDL